MAGHNEIAQLMRIMERAPIRIEESEKKMEMMATTLQNLAK